MPEPVPPPASPPHAPGRWGRRADTLSAGLVLAFAFVAASFVARNSDVWLHLATGRLLAGGNYQFGTDPFAYTTAGTYWANHAWLFDLVLFTGFNWFGGSALVAVKAAAVAATAALMLRAARHRGPVWVGTGCVMLAVLAMSPRLLLQPAVASLPLLAACLCCLRAGGRALAVVPGLIAVWVNTDAWFVLGPALVALFWLGRRLDADRPNLPPWPVWLFPAALGACLLGPHHVHALRLPMELSPAVWASGFRSDPRFAGVFASPWRWGPLGAAGGYRPTAWAFFALLALGLVSFAVNRRAVRGWRAPVWGAFAILAVWQVRLVPFFAVVAGPIAALNLREVWPATAFPRSGRGLVLAAAAALLGLGWLGWTNGVHNRDRGAAWAVHSDPTLERAASGVAAWRKATTAPPDARVFPAHPDVGHYLAWFAPGERYLLDSRLQLFTETAADYTVLSQAIGVLPGSEPAGDALRRHAIVAAVLYDPDGMRMSRGLLSAVGEAGAWEVARIDGAAALVVPKGSADAAARFDAERAAFGGASELPTAGPGPSALADPAPWWRLPRGRGRGGSWEADAATVYLRLAETGTSRSPALPLLAVRASRVGTEADPGDPTAWLALGRAYLLLGERTWEREDGAGLTPLGHVRLLQATGALVQAALLNPDSAPAHESLARLFLRRNMFELGHRHAAAAARLVRRAGALSGESADAFADRTAQTGALVEALEGALRDAENRFLVRTTGLAGDPLARARVAAELGLTQQAIDVLLASHPDLYGAVGLGLLADLLLQTGQVAECRTLLDREELRRNPSALGYYNMPRMPNPDGTRGTYRLHAYDWLDFCQCASAGRYPGALAALERMSERLEAEERQALPPVATGTAVLLASDAGLGVPPTPVVARLLGAAERVALTGLLTQIYALSVARADLATVAGVLDLERGDPRAAAVRFEDALKGYAAAPAAALSRPGRPLAARYSEALRGAR